MNTQDAKEDFRNAPSRDPAELEQETEEARENLRQTLDSLEQSFSPGQILDRALQSWRSGNNEFASNLSRTVKSNPVPVLLSSLGLTWLALSDKRPPPQPQASSSSGPGAKDKARQAMGSAQSRASNAASSLSGQGARARDGFVRMQEEQPFLLGALGLALGAALGGALPRSQREDELIGKYGDQARDVVKRKGEQATTGAARAAEPAREGDRS